MSELWTPGDEPSGTPIVGGAPAGAPSPGPGGPGGPGGLGDGQPTPEELAAMQQMLRQMAATPILVHVAALVNQLIELALLHLHGIDDVPANPADAAVAIDTIAAISDALGDRLGDQAQQLRDVVSQLRLAWVEVQQGGAPEAPTG